VDAIVVLRWMCGNDTALCHFVPLFIRPFVQLLQIAQLEKRMIRDHSSRFQRPGAIPFAQPVVYQNVTMFLGHVQWNSSERKCADTVGTVLVPWAGHFQC